MAVDSGDSLTTEGLVKRILARWLVVVLVITVMIVVVVVPEPVLSIAIFGNQ